MKIKFAIVLVTCFVVISACKKTGVFSGSKINTITNYSPSTGGYSETFTYNENGTVATMVRTDGIKMAVYYQGDTVTVATVNGLGQTTSATEYILNSSGWADTSQGQFVAQHNSNSYTYDVNGQLTLLKTFVNHVLTSQDIYQYNSGKNNNYTQHINSSGVSTYDYYVLAASNANTIGVQNMGEYYLGVSSADLIQTDVQLNQNLDTTDIISYRYRYDGSANVDTMVSYHKSGALKDSITYTYY